MCESPEVGLSRSVCLFPPWPRSLLPLRSFEESRTAQLNSFTLSLRLFTKVDDMHVKFAPVLFLFGSLAAAGKWKKVKHLDQSHLLVRDGYCQGTCASCFGSGNIICEGIMCFNPSAGEQCCADGSKSASTYMESSGFKERLLT